jgi:general secretion pathway protein D
VKFAPKITSFLVAVSLGVAVGLMPQAAIAQDTVTMTFVNADIASVVNTIGKATGKNFIIDPRVTGTMNINAPTPVNKDIAYEILLTALRVHGFAAVEERGVVKIIPEADAKTSGRVLASGVAASGDRIVTQIIPLQNESAAQLATVLRPLVAQNNFIGAYPGNNMLVITDYASNVERIRKIVAAIDVPVSTDLQSIKLQHASAVDIAALLQRLMPEINPNPANPGATPKLSVGVEPRNNMLIVRADTPALMTRIRALVAQVDAPSAANGNINVVYLKNAEAAKVAETLRALLSGSSSQSANTSTGAAFQANSPATASGAGTSSNYTSAVQAYTATNSLIITAPDHVYNSLRAVIDKLDQRRAQVAVETIVVELSANLAAEFGIQWQDLSGLNRAATSQGTQIIGGTNFGTGGNIISASRDLTTVGGGLNIGVVRGRVNIPGLGDVIGLGALAKALESDQRAKILANPVVLTIDNEEGKFVVGQNVPFVTGSFTQSGNSTTNPFQTIERRDIGLTLKVTPLITEGGTVRLKVLHEVSSVAPTPNTSTQLRPADIITNKRSIETTILADDGQIIVLGGLIQDDYKGSDSKVPLLGNIPVIGNLFKYQSKTNDRTHLMVFMRPVVLRDANATASYSQDRYDYIRNRTDANTPTPNLLLQGVKGGELDLTNKKPIEKRDEKVTPAPLLNSPPLPQ